MKTHPLLLPAIASVPALGYGVLLVFAFNTMLQLGHWPFYGHPDPKELGRPILYGLATFSFIVSLATAAIIPLILGVCALMKWEKWKGRKKTTLIQAFSIYAIGVIFWIGDLSFGNLTDWLLD